MPQADPHFGEDHHGDDSDHGHADTKEAHA
jgi:hypothetical protein